MGVSGSHSATENDNGKFRWYQPLYWCPVLTGGNIKLRHASLHASLSTSSHNASKPLEQHQSATSRCSAANTQCARLTDPTMQSSATFSPQFTTVSYGVSTSTRRVGPFDQDDALLSSLSPSDVALLRTALELEQHEDIDRAAEKYIECLSFNLSTQQDTHSESSFCRKNSPSMTGCCLLDTFMSSRETPKMQDSKHANHCCCSSYSLESKLWATIKQRRAASSRGAIVNSAADVLVFNHLGQIFFEKGLHAEAQACYLTALELSPTAYSVLYHLGVLYYAQKKLEQAQRRFSAAATRISFIVCVCMFKRIECFERALHHLPKTPSMDNATADRREEKDSVNPLTIPILFSLGTLHRDSGQYDLAQRYFQRILEQQTRHVAALVLLADCYEQKGNLLDASMLLQTALTLNPSDYTVRRAAIRLARCVGSPEFGTYDAVREPGLTSVS